MFRRKEKKNLQTLLFYRFLSVTGALLLIISVIVYMIQYSELYKNMANDILRTSVSIGDTVDLQISQMDTVCLNVINSTSVKETFKRWSQDEDITPYERVIYQNTLSDALVSIRGVDTSIRQINIYPLEGAGYGIGNYYGRFTAETETLPWYQSAKEKDGYRYVTTGTNRLLSSYSGTGSDRLCVSLYRMYFDNYRNPLGFVEVQKYYDELLAGAISPLTAADMDITVYDSDGVQIYPYLEEDTSGGFDYYSALSDIGAESGNTRLYNNVENQREYIAFSRLDYSSFTVVGSIRNIDFFLPILKSLMWIPLLAISLFAVC